MFNNFISGRIDKKMYLQLFKTLLLISNGVGLLIYGFLHFLFFDFPFETAEEAIILVKLFGVASTIAAGLCLVLLITDWIDLAMRQPVHFAIPLNLKTIASIALLLVIIFSSCQGKLPLMGVEKDLNTGLVTTYKNLKPGKVLMVMNDEVLNHTDIPMGESFLLVNDQLTGLVAKEGKVSVGASLIISDKTGKVLLKEDDLFRGKDVFHKDSVNYLKCTVPTGKPMEWEEKYDVAVTFWDKYGDGKIENKVTIRCIDIP